MGTTDSAVHREPWNKGKIVALKVRDVCHGDQVATRAIVMQNIVFALAVKGVFLVLGAFGIATMWEAVIADVGVALAAVLNATRAMRTGRK